MNERYVFRGATVAAATVDERVAFLRRVYAHLAVAIGVFVAIEAILVPSELGWQVTRSLLGTRGGWLIVLGGFMLIGWLADHWASPNQSKTMQYVGLSIYVVAEAIVFLPLLVIAYHRVPGAIPTAGLITAILFGGLTAIVFITKKDFSWLRNLLFIAGLAAMGTIVASLIFGFTLGVFFSGLMVAFAGAYILYYTSNILHKYPTTAHVAAALQLFASVALLFWYVLRIVMSRR